MCGIVGFVGKQSAAPILLKGLQQLEYRGYDSAGIAVMSEDRIRVEKVSGRITRLCEKTENGAAVPGSIGIGHTRWATHGAPTRTCPTTGALPSYTTGSLKIIWPCGRN